MTRAIFDMVVEDYGTTPEVQYLPALFFAELDVPEKWTVHLKITKGGEYIFDELLSVEEAQAIRDKLNDKIDESYQMRGARL